MRVLGMGMIAANNERKVRESPSASGFVETLSIFASTVVATVAKNARIMWALLGHQRAFVPVD